MTEISPERKRGIQIKATLWLFKQALRRKGSFIVNPGAPDYMEEALTLLLDEGTIELEITDEKGARHYKEVAKE